MKSHFFAYMARMKNIKRWGLMRNNQEENIQEHSLQVAMIAHCLAVVHNEIFGGQIDAGAVTALAVYHETSEVITGDLPTPIKYFNPEIREAYHAVEHVADMKMLAMLPDELRDAYRPLLLDRDGNLYRYVKAADRISAYAKCLEELKAGNGEFEKAGKTILESIHAMEMPEAEYFLQTFMDSFSLTLDELN